MSKKLFSKFIVLLLVVGLLFAVAPKQAMAQGPTTLNVAKWSAPVNTGLTGRPSVVYLDGTYHMWYGNAGNLYHVSSSSADFTGATGQIAVFSGTKSPIEKESVSVTPYYEYSTGMFIMVAYSDTVKDFAGYYSFNGVNWTFGADVGFPTSTFLPTDYQKIDAPQIYRNGALDYQGYFQLKTATGAYQIWRATFNMTPYPVLTGAALVLEAVSPDTRVHHPTVIKDGATTYMWYASQDQLTIDLAKSTNGGNNWTKSAANPIINVGFSAEPSVVKVGDTWHMYYMGAGNAIQHVSANGPFEFQTIQAAINVAADGDIINVAAGTYVEDIDVAKPVTLLGPNAGTPGSSTRVDEAIIQGTSESWVGLYVEPDVPGVTVDGFKFDGINLNPGSAYTVGVFSDSSDFTVQNNVFVNQKGNGIMTSAVYYEAGWKYDKWLTDIVIKDNLIINDVASLSPYNYGIYFQSSLGNITGNVVTNFRSGIQVQPYWNTPGGGTVEGNTFNVYKLGMYFNYAEHSTADWLFEDNIVTGLPLPTGQADTSWQGIRVETFSAGNVSFEKNQVTFGTASSTDKYLYYENNVASAATPSATPNWWGSVNGPAAGAYVGKAQYLPYCLNPECTEFSQASLSFSPATMNVSINDTTDKVVEIMVKDVVDLTSYHMEVTFDQNKLQIIKVEDGGFLSSGGGSASTGPGNDLGNTTGRMIFDVARFGGNPVTGSGSLIKITFKPIALGETSFVIDATTSHIDDWPNAFKMPYTVTGGANVNIVGFGDGVPFGYVAYDTLTEGWLRGVSTDFTIVGANLTDAQSLVVKLWGGTGGTTLLQTNTANLTGTKFDGFTAFTSPFDIFGGFDYTHDGYWTNTKASEYGQTVTPTCVEAIATLADGTVISKKYCGALEPGDRSLLLRGTIAPDGGTGQVPGGTPLTITNENGTVSYTGLIEWYPADAALGRSEGNRVGVQIDAPTAFNTAGFGTTFTVFGNTYTWDVVKDGTNFVWIYPKVTEVPQSWDIVVNWGGNISQTFAVKVLTGSTLNTPPLPTITSTDVTGPYIPGVPREFNFNVSNAGGAYYALATFDYKIAGVSKSDITKFEYFDETGAWRLMGSRPEETYEDCDSGTAICGQFGWAPNGFGPFPADFSGNSKFRITFKNGKTAELPLTLTLKGKKAATDTDWTVLQTFTANIHVYENVTIGGTMPVYYLVGDEGASSFTINNPAGGAPYGNHVEFNLTILNAVKADITSATCTYGPITLDVLYKLSEVGDNLTGTLIGADGAFTVPAPLSASIPCTIKFNTAKQYVTTAEMVYVVGSDKYAVASNTATAVVYPKPVITSSDLPGVFQQGVAKAVTVNVNNVGAMYTPNSFTLHLDLPAGTVVVYGGTSYTCTATGCDIPVTLAAGDNALALTITFNAPSTADIGISLVDPAVDPDRTLATFTVANLVHASIGSVTGTVTMQGRLVYDMAEFTLTGLTGFGPYKSTSNAAGALSFANLVATEYTVTTNMPRFLNITADMAKKITLSANDALNTLWLRGGNAYWRVTDGNGAYTDVYDNVVNGGDASVVGTGWGQAGSTDLTINHGDVNFDNKVNIQDLALVGGNYDLTSAAAYAAWLP